MINKYDVNLILIFQLLYKKNTGAIEKNITKFTAKYLIRLMFSLTN